MLFENYVQANAVYSQADLLSDKSSDTGSLYCPIKLVNPDELLQEPIGFSCMHCTDRPEEHRST